MARDAGRVLARPRLFLADAVRHVAAASGAGGVSLTVTEGPECGRVFRDGERIVAPPVWSTTIRGDGFAAEVEAGGSPDPVLAAAALDAAGALVVLLARLAAARSDALHDPLTGLANRRLLDDRLAGAIEEGNRYGTSFAVALIDMNNFKWFNDTFGHAEGDALLRSFADVLRVQARRSDVAGRFGGDEFLVLMPRTAGDDAWRLIDRLERELRRFLVRYEPTTAVLGFSCGVAQFPDDGRDVVTLVKRADGRLYAAKQAAGIEPR